MPIRLLVGPESGSAHLMIFFRLILCAEILRTIKGFVNFCYSLLVNDFKSVQRATFLVLVDIQPNWIRIQGANILRILT